MKYHFNFYLDVDNESVASVFILLIELNQRIEQEKVIFQSN